MKAPVLLLIVLLSFTACQKTGNLIPQTGPSKSKGNDVNTGNTDTVAVKTDSIPNNSAFRLEFYKDNSNYDETLFMFKKSATVNYLANEDAAYMTGFGELSLSSISNDGKNLSINTLPYTQGMSVGLDVEAKNDGDYSLQVSYENKMPDNIQVWLKDTYLKDSVNVRSANYKFSVSKADVNSFGNKRFVVTIK
jgi:hypothetical protein